MYQPQVGDVVNVKFKGKTYVGVVIRLNANERGDVHVEIKDFNASGTASGVYVPVKDLTRYVPPPPAQPSE